MGIIYFISVAAMLTTLVRFNVLPRDGAHEEPLVFFDIDDVVH